MWIQCGAATESSRRFVVPHAPARRAREGPPRRAIVEQGGRRVRGPRRARPRRATNGGPAMVKIWSELPQARLKEQVADAATAVWLLFWGGLIVQLYTFLAGFAEAGRSIRSGGAKMA